MIDEVEAAQVWKSKNRPGLTFTVRSVMRPKQAGKVPTATGEFHWATGRTTGIITLRTLTRTYAYSHMDWRMVLQPFGEMWSDYERKIIAAVQDMTLRQLYDLRDACNAATAGAWYAIWYCADDTRDVVLQEIYRRKHTEPIAHHCSKMTKHDEHEWTAMKVRYACSGHRVHEGGFRGTPVRVNA